jgi:hypothetical protein
MKKISWRRISILGTVLMAASAVTAAMLPNKSNAIRADHPGSLTAAGTAEGSPVASCTTTSGPTYGDDCTVDNLTVTTTAGANSAVDSTVGISHAQTLNNTTR